MKSCIFLLSLLVLSVFSADPVPRDVTQLTAAVDATKTKISVSATCQGTQGTDFDTLYLGLAPTSPATTFTLASIRTALGQDTSVVKDFIYQGGLKFEATKVSLTADIPVTGLNNSNVKYTLAAFCGLTGNENSGVSKTADVNTPENGGQPVVIQVVYTGSFDAKAASTSQRAAFLKVLNLQAGNVYDLFGSSSAPSFNVNGSSISTFVLRDYTAASDTTSKTVLDYVTAKSFDALKTELNNGLAGLGTALSSVTAQAYLPVAATIPYISTVVTGTNITVNVVLNNTDSVAIVGDFGSVASGNTYSAKSIFSGNNDKGVAALLKNSSVLFAPNNASFTFNSNAYNKYSFYVVALSGVGEYQTYSNVTQTSVYLRNDNSSSNLTALTSVVNTTTKSVVLSATCSGIQGVDFDGVDLVATPDNSASSYNLSQIRSGKIQNFLFFSRLNFTNDQNTIVGGLSFTVLKNAGILYNLKAYCSLSSNLNAGAANSTSWTQPDNGGKDISFTAVYANVTTVGNLSLIQALALVNTLGLNGNFVYDQNGNKAVKTPAVNSKIRLLADSTVSIQTVVVRDFSLASDVAGSTVETESKTPEFLTSFKGNLTAQGAPATASVQSVNASSYSPVNPVVTAQASASAPDNGITTVTFSVSLNAVGTVGYVGDLTKNIGTQNFTSAQKILAGTNDAGVAQPLTGSAIAAAANTAVNFTIKTNATSELSFYVAGTNTLGSYQLYSSIVNVKVSIGGGASFGWRFGVFVLAVLGLIFFN